MNICTDIKHAHKHKVYMNRLTLCVMVLNEQKATVKRKKDLKGKRKKKKERTITNR